MHLTGLLVKNFSYINQKCPHVSYEQSFLITPPPPSTSALIFSLKWNVKWSREIEFKPFPKKHPVYIYLYLILVKKKLLFYSVPFTNTVRWLQKIAHTFFFCSSCLSSSLSQLWRCGQTRRTWICDRKLKVAGSSPYASNSSKPDTHLRNGLDSLSRVHQMSTNYPVSVIK